ncbi:arginyl-tRNA--protein transferase 1-like isoform X3 [Asterias amurensis]|uniref:arginyl-tRNA--protein transferase 1-like isoform X3 n=1 Tax=Asterias amurensis TaxID=7602 RepID=UPI003AB45B98
MANTIVEYMHEHGGYRCGYCGNPDSNFSHGMWAHALSCQDYQDLIDRGWRRSGSYLYKPLMDKMCCPCFTIRCAALEFKPSKSQKKVIKKTIRYLVSGEKPDCNKPLSEDSTKVEDEEILAGTSEHPAQEKELRKITSAAAKMASTSVASAAETSFKSKSTERTERTEGQNMADHKVVQNRKSNVKEKERGRLSVKREPRPGVGADQSKPQCKKAKELRRQKRMERLSQAGTDAEPVDKKQPNEPKSLEELIEEAEKASHGHKHKLEFKLVRSHPASREFQETFKESHLIFAKYQRTIHKEPDDECEETDFKRFLVDSPLREEHSPGAPECGYGSFHEHFILDGKIIAVGVIDILPSCVSSVYFFYDPDYSFLSLGTYSALRELEFTRLLHLQAPKIIHYYMGFYIHSCIKMRYKGRYKPSFLLCPEAYNWHPIERCFPKLEASKYARLDETDAVDTPVQLKHVRILHMQTAMQYPDYRTFVPHADDEQEVKEYAQYVGKTCAGRMLLYRQ